MRRKYDEKFVKFIDGLIGDDEDEEVNKPKSFKEKVLSIIKKPKPDHWQKMGKSIENLRHTHTIGYQPLSVGASNAPPGMARPKPPPAPPRGGTGAMRLGGNMGISNNGFSGRGMAAMAEHVTKFSFATAYDAVSQDKPSDVYKMIEELDSVVYKWDCEIDTVLNMRLELSNILLHYFNASSSNNVSELLYENMKLKKELEKFKDLNNILYD